MKIATLKNHAERHNAKLIYSRTCDMYFAHDPAYTAGIRAGKLFDKATLENMSAEQFYTEVIAPLFPDPAAGTVERINAEKLDWLPHPTNDAIYLRADHDGIWACYVADDKRICRKADSWIAAPRVSLDKPEAPVCACILADVPQESNADVMARTLAVVRANRITREYVESCHPESIESRLLPIMPPEVVTALAMGSEDARLAAEYLAAKDGEPAMLDAGMSGNEQVRALAHEQARADADVRGRHGRRRSDGRH